MPCISARSWKFVRLLLVVLIPAVLVSIASSQEALFRSDMSRSGVFSGSGPLVSPKVKWKFHTAGQILASPVVANGTVYVGGGDHLFYALDAKDGSVKWKFETGGRLPGSAAVFGGAVYFLSYDSNFYSLDAATGKLNWKFKTEGERRFAAKHLHGAEPANETMPDPFDFFLSSPVIENGLVYFGSGDSNVYALATKDGSLKWKFKTGDVVHASPALANGTLYIGSWDSYLYALDAATGNEKWRFKSGEDPAIHNQQGFQASPAVVDGVVYIGCRDSKFYAVEAATGKQLWSFSNKGSWVISSAAVKDGKVYFATSDTGLLHALDAKTEAPVFSLDFKHWPMFSSPAITGDTLYIGSHQGHLIAIDLKSQKPAWIFETETSKSAAANYTKSDGTPKYEAAFFDFFYDDMIIGISKMFSLGPILSSPFISDGVLYVGSADGNLYALE